MQMLLGGWSGQWRYSVEMLTVTVYDNMAGLSIHDPL